MRLKNYDYYLIILTTLILFAIGLVSVYGITYYNYLSVDPQWTQTARYGKYIDEMNSYIYPFLLLLLISLGLCIPKRLFEQDILVKFGAAVLGVTVMLMFLKGIETGLGFILAVMIAVQAVVLILTFKKSQAIRFEKEGYVIRLGSSLLHLGVVILVFNFVSLRNNPFHILIFWIGTLLVVAGNIFSFYPEKITSLLILIK
jgi:NADH:ubiquinone oxidoreductase subunit 6 (subunit J)